MHEVFLHTPTLAHFYRTSLLHIFRRKISFFFCSPCKFFATKKNALCTFLFFIMRWCLLFWKMNAGRCSFDCTIFSFFFFTLRLCIMWHNAERRRGVLSPNIVQGRVVLWIFIYEKKEKNEIFYIFANYKRLGQFVVVSGSSLERFF